MRSIRIGCERRLTHSRRDGRYRPGQARGSMPASPGGITMARAKQKESAGGRAQDAIALLKADHRQVEEWFEQFEKARDSERKQELATKICNALKVHTTIEEEIFYPAFLEASDDIDIHHEAEIEASSPNDDYFEPSVKVLSEMIKHHVKEEEKPGGMFAVARESKMDLVA